jgi:hypothetical protein
MLNLQWEDNTPKHLKGRSNIQTGAKFLAKFLRPHDKNGHPKLRQSFCQNFCNLKKCPKLGQFLKDKGGGFTKVAYHFKSPVKVSSSAE